MNIKNPLNLAYNLRSFTSGPDCTLRVFLAAPYYDSNEQVRYLRFLAANEIAAKLTVLGYAVFSPLSHGCAIAQDAPELPTDAAFWERINLPVLEICDALAVVQDEGALTSAGVRGEVIHAHSRDIPVNFVAMQNGELLSEPNIDPMLWASLKARR